MKRFLIAALLLLATACRTDHNTIRPLPGYTDRWEVRAGKYDGKPILLRINLGLDSMAIHTPLAWQAAASVPMKVPTEKGLADPDEVEKLKKIEKLLTYRLVAPGLAVFSLRVESDGRCDFIFYTDNRSAVSKVFDHCSAMITDYHVNFSIKRDKKWITYRWFFNFRE